MTRGKKVILIIVASFFGLLVLANSFLLWILIDSNQKQNENIDMRHSIYMDTLLINDKATLAKPEYKSRVKEIMADMPTLLRSEPVIFLANPDIKPIVADILAENPDILQNDIELIARYPELFELNSNLKDVVKEIMQDPNVKGTHPRVESMI